MNADKNRKIYKVSWNFFALAFYIGILRVVRLFSEYHPRLSEFICG